MTALSLTLATLSGAFISGFIVYLIKDNELRKTENILYTYSRLAAANKKELDELKAKKRK